MPGFHIEGIVLRAYVIPVYNCWGLPSTTYIIRGTEVDSVTNEASWVPGRL